MSRNIVTVTQTSLAKAAAPSAQPATADNYATQIIKLIPSEIIGVYIGIINLIKAQDIDFCTLGYFHLWVFLIILLLVPIYMKRAADVTDNKQVFVSMLSFAVWGMALSGWVEILLSCLDIRLAIPAGVLCNVVVMLYTLVVPVLYNK